MAAREIGGCWFATTFAAVVTIRGIRRPGDS